MNNTTSIILTAGIFICLGLLKNFLEDRFFPPDTKRRKINYSKKQLLTNAETNFFESLKTMIGDDYYVFPEIPMLEIMRPKDNHISQKRIDFVVFDKNYNPVLAIELDDYSHEREDRKTRDKFVDEACASAGINIIHCNLNDIPNLKEKLVQYLK
jgi:hypothetical protein